MKFGIDVWYQKETVSILYIYLRTVWIPFLNWFLLDSSCSKRVKNWVRRANTKLLGIVWRPTNTTHSKCCVPNYKNKKNTWFRSWNEMNQRKEIRSLVFNRVAIWTIFVLNRITIWKFRTNTTQSSFEWPFREIEIMQLSNVDCSYLQIHLLNLM